MRHVQAFVPAERRAAVLDRLDEEGIDYVLTAEAGDRADGSVVQFPLPTQAVEHVMDELRDAGLDDEYVVVDRAETVRTARFDELEERFVSDDEEDESIAHEEIRTKARNMTPHDRSYYAMTLLSAVVATAGLLLDSPAIVVGSMVIAPQVGSALTASVGIVLDDREMTVEGLRSQVAGLALAVVGATAFGLALKSTGFVPPALDVTTVEQISKRISPGALSLAVGVAAGAAGAFGLATALPVSLVGVMIAAAIIPAAAAVGVGVAWGLPVVALGALVLLVINATAVNLASVAVLRRLGYRPGDAPTRAALRRGSVLAVVALLAVAAVAGVGLTRQMAFENDANAAVEDVLGRAEYRHLELLAVRTEFDDGGLFGSQEEVTVAVSRPADAPVPDLARAIAERVRAETGQPVVVTVEFRDRRRYRTS